MTNYFKNGVEIFPAIIFDPEQNWGFGVTTATASKTLALVAGPNASSPTEAITLTTAGTLTVAAVTISGTVTASSNLSVTGTATIGGTLSASSNATISGAFQISTTTMAETITGIHSVILSTYAPGALAASTGRLDKVASTAFTFTTNDFLDFNLPSSYASTGVGIAGCFPTSSGGVGLNWFNATTGSLTPSTGAYSVLVFRTT